MKTIGELGKEINRTDEKKRLLGEVRIKETEIALSLIKEKEECNHGILILLGDEPFPVTKDPKQLYVCLECGCTFAYPSTDPTISQTVENAIVLDFSKNPSSFMMRGTKENSGYIIVTALRKLIVEASKNNPDMTIEEFIKTIPEDWYTNPTTFDDEERVKK